MKVLLSIKPEFSEQIFSGKKRYEFRKAIFKRDVATVVVYTTLPVGKVTGEFTIETIHSGCPRDIWKLSEGFSGVPWRFFFRYFRGKSKAYAIEVGQTKKYEVPLDLSDVVQSGNAPQSFVYL